MKKFFLSLYDKIIAVEGVEYCRKWNNQLALIIQDGGARSQMFPMPAVFIAFKTNEIQQLGEGRQMFYVDFDLHILDWQMDSGDGNFEQNLTVYDLKDKVFQAIQKFQPGLTDTAVPVGSCIRISEQEDNDHNGVYHFIQSYRTTYVEQLMVEPVGGSETTIVPMPLELDITKAEVIDQSEAYDPTKQYLVANETIVSYQDKYYSIGLDTPNPAGVFNETYWTLRTDVNNFTPTA